jgi:hypothetical protein
VLCKHICSSTNNQGTECTWLCCSISRTLLMQQHRACSFLACLLLHIKHLAWVAAACASCCPADPAQLLPISPFWNAAAPNKQPYGPNAGIQMPMGVMWVPTPTMHPHMHPHMAGPVAVGPYAPAAFPCSTDAYLCITSLVLCTQLSMYHACHMCGLTLILTLSLAAAGLQDSTPAQ